MTPMTNRLSPVLATLLALAALPAQADQVINDDLIVTSSICAGSGCVENTSFGFTTLLVNAPDAAVRFTDTSTGAFPSNDWQVGMISSTGSFYIQDVDGGTNVLTLGASGDAVVLGSGGTLEDGTVSVSGLRVSNVADGVADTDAVTLGQLNAALSETSGSADAVAAANTEQLAVLGREIDAVGAIGSAMSALQVNPRGTGDHFLSIGMGLYEGSAALAVGSFHFLADDTIFVNTGISRATNGTGGTAARVGFTFGG